MKLEHRFQPHVSCFSEASSQSHCDVRGWHRLSFGYDLRSMLPDFIGANISVSGLLYCFIRVHIMKLIPFSICIGGKL